MKRKYLETGRQLRNEKQIEREKNLKECLN